MRDIKAISSALCPDFVVDVQEGRTPCIVTSLYYPNRDSINLFFGRDGEELEVSDEGTTIENLVRSGVELTPDRKKIIRLMCEKDEVTFLGKRLSMKLRADSIGTGCLAFCQTLGHVSSMHFHQTQQSRSALPRAVDSLLRERVKPVRPFVRNWKDVKHDPTGSFPVDYHLNGSLPARNLFFVTSDSKALLVTAVVHFLRSHKIEIPTMTVVDPKADVHAKQIERLQFASTELRFGIKGNEEVIVSFALGKDGATASVK